MNILITQPFAKKFTPLGRKQFRALARAKATKKYSPLAKPRGKIPGQVFYFSSVK